MMRASMVNGHAAAPLHGILRPACIALHPGRLLPDPRYYPYLPPRRAVRQAMRGAWMDVGGAMQMQLALFPSFT
jgi:hypothetical protein